MINDASCVCMSIFIWIQLHVHVFIYIFTYIYIYILVYMVKNFSRIYTYNGNSGRHIFNFTNISKFVSNMIVLIYLIPEICFHIFIKTLHFKLKKAKLYFHAALIHNYQITSELCLLSYFC